MSNVTTAEVLGAPLQINKLTLKNRIIVGPMAVLQPTEDGRPSDQSIAFLKRRAEGGAGAVFVGGSVATARAFRESPFAPNIRYDDDQFIPHLKRLVDEVHGMDVGVAVFAQLFPAFGRMGVPRDGHRISSASPKPVNMGGYGLPDNVYIPGGRVTPLPDEATIDEIKDLEQAVVDAARRAQAAGFDGIEIGAHMSYFYSSFLSPLSNFRTDEYGGSVENRARAEGHGRCGSTRDRSGYPARHPAQRERPRPRWPGSRGLRRGRRGDRQGGAGLPEPHRRQLRVDEGQRHERVGEDAARR